MKQHIPKIIIALSILISVVVITTGYLLFTEDGNKLIGQQPSVSVSSNPIIKRTSFAGKKPGEVLKILASETKLAAKGLETSNVFAKPDFELEFLP
jgi:hypothetical protein